jgi:hypothetical protein
MKSMKFLLFTLAFVSCPSLTAPPVPDVPLSTPDTPGSTAPTLEPVFVNTDPGASTLDITNDTDNSVRVFLAFGSNSVVLPSSQGLAFCQGSGLNCDFEMSKRTSRHMPLAGKYLNATISFDKPVTCNTTKAEININNPLWYDIADISLVDGFNKSVAIDIVSNVESLMLGPPNGVSGNEMVFGLYPNGCDICTARQSPPCGMRPGSDGCKKGTQYKPDVPCQWQGPTMGGGGSQMTVRLMAGVPL